ncbi:MAG: nucleotidyltransferase domain-containing protein [Proteobacteria bacterium]|nr:nucleotidyltransferase domain-containing protein [Pseudomonadota bacterium]
MNLSPEQQHALAAVCGRYRIRALQMFGSAAVGLETADSDVDLLVEFTPGQAPSAFELVDLRDALSQLFGGRPVDLAFAGILDNPYRRRAIVPQLRPLYPRTAAA